MPRYYINWALQGQTIIEASTAKEALDRFNARPISVFAREAADCELVQQGMLIETRHGVFDEIPEKPHS